MNAYISFFFKYNQTILKNKGAGKMYSACCNYLKFSCCIFHFSSTLVLDYIEINYIYFKTNLERKPKLNNK